MAMTLEEASKALRADAAFWVNQEGKPMVQARLLRNYADAIDAHLTQPAQAVDVGAIREVIESLLVWPSTSNKNMAAKLTSALAGEQAGWRVPDGWNLMPDLLSEEMREAMESEWKNQNAFRMWDALKAASPTPDKETQR